ncbi:hypothetical protein SCHPADRAFT_901086 [Schizopora paradoxa]|uniref:Uncharacterized protein n=1 Tax=Schizopora paradoxa TaxID=27342 RepID=A0A0H2S5N8_9AGAM|nr:hypothetical protein SCHPADRAFT_901086 [Schizopora paradoxa]
MVASSPVTFLFAAVYLRHIRRARNASSDRLELGLRGTLARETRLAQASCLHSMRTAPHGPPSPYTRLGISLPGLAEPLLSLRSASPDRPDVSRL